MLKVKGKALASDKPVSNTGSVILCWMTLGMLVVSRHISCLISQDGRETAATWHSVTGYKGYQQNLEVIDQISKGRLYWVQKKKCKRMGKKFNTQSLGCFKL